MQAAPIICVRCADPGMSHAGGHVLMRMRMHVMLRTHMRMHTQSSADDRHKPLGDCHETYLVQSVRLVMPGSSRPRKPAQS
jgi:hypothetical protein